MRSMLFFPAPGDALNDRFSDFIDWARPFGTAGINHIHASNYVASAPYFEWSDSFLAHGDKNTRSWLLKHEDREGGRLVFSRARGAMTPTIHRRESLIETGRFLDFAKAYLNVMTYYRNLRSPAKPMVSALTLLEKSLRDLNSGDNNPSNLKCRVFEQAINALEETTLSHGKKYDIGKELEIAAGMLQGGYNSKTFRFSNKGFQLLTRPFAFSSSIKSKPRLRVLTLNSPDLHMRVRPLITSEEVAAIGIAYRKSLVQFGIGHTATFMASIAGLALTTVSMRVSDLLTLRRDAIFKSEDDCNRHRIRLSRPKTGISQNLPLTKKLGDLAENLFANILSYSSEAHDALDFYVNKFGDHFDSIDELYLPNDLRELFAKRYLTVPEVFKAMRNAHEDENPTSLPGRLRNAGLESFWFIDEPNDIWRPHENRILGNIRYSTIGEIESGCQQHGLTTSFPLLVPRHLYASESIALIYVNGKNKKEKRRLLGHIFASGRTAYKNVRTDKFIHWLLQEFKNANQYPHWPYVSKDRNTRVNEALLVWHQAARNPHAMAGESQPDWWQPTLVTAATIGEWINKSWNGGPPFLFEKLQVKLANGEYPSLTLHSTRKFYHTKALMAGAQEVFIDELAGRKSGVQSDHYDQRTPHEILSRSIEFFDPEADFAVIGPVAERAALVTWADRSAFLYESAAPKHFTEIGGCATDWALDPCKQYGDCMRCDQHLWRKGDENRLGHIKAKYQYAKKMIEIAERKVSGYASPPRSLVLQLDQFKDELQRCSQILAIEENGAVALGTIVTFDAPSRSMTNSELTNKLARTPNIG